MHNHNSINTPNDPMALFRVQVVDLPEPDTIAARAENLEGVTWSLQRGTPFSETVFEAIHLPNAELVALCAAFGYYVPLDIIRDDPLAVIGELAKVLAAPEAIPACIRAARYRA